MEASPSVEGGGDETYLGRSICSRTDDTLRDEESWKSGFEDAMELKRSFARRYIYFLLERGWFFRRGVRVEAAKSRGG